MNRRSILRGIIAALTTPRELLSIMQPSPPPLKPQFEYSYDMGQTWHSCDYCNRLELTLPFSFKGDWVRE